jgi:outer membrane lipoprotein SlyB
MNKDEIYGVARAFLGVFGGFAVARGWVDSESAAALAGAIATLVAAWSIKSKRK